MAATNEYKPDLPKRSTNFAWSLDAPDVTAKFNGWPFKYCLKDKLTYADGLSVDLGKVVTFGRTFPGNEAQPVNASNAIDINVRAIFTGNYLLCIVMVFATVALMRWKTNPIR